MDFLIEFTPSPDQRPPLKAQSGETEVERPVSDKERVAAYVFKTIADPFAGRLSFFKVCSGVLKNDAALVAVRSGSQERLAHLSVPQGKQMLPVNELHAGDIGVVAKLKDVLTGDTLCEKGDTISFPNVKVPEPSIAYAIAAKSRNDEDRMGNAMQRILEEDPGLRFYRDAQTKDFLLAGSGGQHVEIVVSRLKKRYNVDVELRAPKIPYRETIRGHADVHGRHKKQTGGHGQFGDIKVKVAPRERGAGFEFVNDIFGGAVPRNFIPAVEKGFIEAAARGYLAGYPMVDFQVTLYDGQYHDVDSSEMSFKLAARKAFKLAMEQAKAVLLEPIMKVEVIGPVEFAGDLMGDMNSRRGRITGMDSKGGTQIVRAVVPMAEMLTYQNDLTSMTQGRASFTMEFDHYDYVPQLQSDKIIAAAKALMTGERAACRASAARSPEFVLRLRQIHSRPEPAADHLQCRRRRPQFYRRRDHHHPGRRSVAHALPSLRTGHAQFSRYSHRDRRPYRPRRRHLHRHGQRDRRLNHSFRARDHDRQRARPGHPAVTARAFFHRHGPGWRHPSADLRRAQHRHRTGGLDGEGQPHPCHARLVQRLSGERKHRCRTEPSRRHRQRGSPPSWRWPEPTTVWWRWTHPLRPTAPRC